MTAKVEYANVTAEGRVEQGSTGVAHEPSERRFVLSICGEHVLGTSDFAEFYTALSAAVLAAKRGVPA